MNISLPKGFSYMAIAVAAGLVATFGIHRYVAVKTAMPPVVTGSVVIAGSDMSPGTALNGQILKVASWPKELIPPQAASSLKQVEGRVVNVPISSGEPLLLKKLAPEGTAAGLSGLLDDSKRAVTVRVDDVSGVAGFLHPGDRVDVLADLKIQEIKESFSKTVLQNIVVMTTGQVWEQKGDHKPAVVNTVTLEVTPEQAEVLNLASNEGKIRLALRSRRNQAVVETSGVATSQLFNGISKSSKKEAAAPPRRNEQTVEVIKGLERTKATL